VSEPTRDIYDYSIDLLSRRAYSTFKLDRKLRQKKYPPNEIEVVLKLLRSERYLRDDLYADARARTWARKGHSASQIKRLLASEKLEISLIRVHEIFSESERGEEDELKKLLQTHLRRISSVPTDRKAFFKLKQKISAALARKGHSFSAFNLMLDQELKLLQARLS